MEPGPQRGLIILGESEQKKHIRAHSATTNQFQYVSSQIKSRIYKTSSRTIGAPSLSSKFAWALVSANGFVLQLFDTGIASTTKPFDSKLHLNEKDFEPQVNQGKVGYGQIPWSIPKRVIPGISCHPQVKSKCISMISNQESFWEQNFNFDNGRKNSRFVPFWP